MFNKTRYLYDKYYTYNYYLVVYLYDNHVAHVQKNNSKISSQ